ncbi:hypothetical protein BZG36_05432 [Bifiguratus adelaidae]|uniref:Peptidase S54 rhomboid domain-containing protein n=1 Tax=Bifiguratus adelaidae TaxID=1938954 RepID=A0A261XU40_9FUNG|nr:hypothetical protein BZG36_05432 [Bifiguratus adelaidae]
MLALRELYCHRLLRGFAPHRQCAVNTFRKNPTGSLTGREPFRLQTFRPYIRPHYYENDLSSVYRRNNTLVRRIARKIDDLPPGTVLWTLIGANTAVYLTWQYAVNSYSQFRDPSWLSFMLNNFVLSDSNLRAGRLHTLITSFFSHRETGHLAINMLVLYSIGGGVLEALGTLRFLGLYGASGVAAGLAHLAYTSYIRPYIIGARRGSKSLSGTIGASGAVMGITTFFACAFPRATFLVFFVVPMPAIAVVGLFAAYDIYRAATIAPGKTDSASHIGGGLYGLTYYFLRVRPRLGRWRF